MYRHSDTSLKNRGGNLEVPAYIGRYYMLENQSGFTQRGVQGGIGIAQPGAQVVLVFFTGRKELWVA